MLCKQLGPGWNNRSQVTKALRMYIWLVAVNANSVEVYNPMFYVQEGTLYSAIIKYIYAFIVIPYKATHNIETVPSLATSLLGSYRATA